MSNFRKITPRMEIECRRERGLAQKIRGRAKANQELVPVAQMGRIKTRRTHRSSTRF